VPLAIDYVKSGDLWIAYAVMGEGSLDLLWVPPYASNLAITEDWPPVAEAFERLTPFARLITLNKRGTGLSDRLGDTDTFEDAMDDLRAVLDAVGSKQAAVLGLSDGGALSALFAATHPERVSALVLVSAFARRAWAPDYPWGWTSEEQARLLETWGRDWGRRPLGLGVLSPSLAHDERYREYMLRVQRLGTSRGGLLAWARWVMQIDIRNILSVIKVPTLVIHSVGDRTVTVDNGRYLAEHIPGARLVELAGDDHLIGDRVAVTDEIEEFLTGQRPILEPDRVLATVLFTDIVASTERAAALGDRHWRELLDAHDRSMRTEIDRHRGREIKTMGDAFMATFDGPARAIRCAVAMTAAARSLGIDVRAGLHAGECEVRGEDVGGLSVHIGARVAGLAGSGEVLVSSTVKDLGDRLGYRFRGPRIARAQGGARRVAPLFGQELRTTPVRFVTDHRSMRS